MKLFYRFPDVAHQQRFLAAGFQDVPYYEPGPDGGFFLAGYNPDILTDDEASLPPGGPVLEVDIPDAELEGLRVPCSLPGNWWQVSAKTINRALGITERN